ncbi:hypothetical protein AHAS_Ahas04G0194700 [Arachis hypogaea]
MMSKIKRQALLDNLNNNNAASNKFNGKLTPAVQRNLKFTLILIFADSDSASCSRSDSEAWPMCGVLPKKMICFTASFECAASIHGLGSVVVNIVYCFILDGFLVAAQLLEKGGVKGWTRKKGSFGFEDGFSNALVAALAVETVEC